MFTKLLITPRDLLATPEEEVVLEVEAEKVLLPFVDPAFEGAEIELEGVGRAKAGAGGRAEFRLGRLGVGLHRFEARLEGAAPATALVQVAACETPLFVTDIDKTIADVSSVAFPFRSNASVAAFESAREVLEVIGRTMAIVYLSARDHIFTAKTKDWLRRHAFPEGPLYVRRVRFWSASPRRHKLARLAEICSRFPNVRWGVGDLVGDVEAYAARNIRPILLTSKRRDGLPANCLTASSWKEIAQIVARPD